jgi:predicted secreted protein
MTNKREPLSVNLSKMILAVSVIISLGTIFGVMGYLASHPSKTIVPVMNTLPIIDPRCDQKVTSGPCKCAAVGYEFDSILGLCSQVGAGCCDFSTPFNSLEECEKACEKPIEIKTVVIGEDFLIILDANPSTGYTWEADSFDKNYLTLQSKDFISDRVSPEMVDAGGKEVFTFAPIKAGETTIIIKYLKSLVDIKEAKVYKYRIVEEEDVSTTTDKTIYEQGETIKIVVNNGLDKSILYSGWGG